jgi:hypothetical protein
MLQEISFTLRSVTEGGVGRPRPTVTAEKVKAITPHPQYSWHNESFVYILAILYHP